MRFATIVLSSEYLIVVLAVLIFWLLRRAGAGRSAGSATLPGLRWAAAGAVIGCVAFLLPITTPYSGAPGPGALPAQPWQVLPIWVPYVLPATFGVVGAMILWAGAARWARLRTSGHQRGLDPRPRHWWALPPATLLIAWGSLLGAVVSTVIIGGWGADVDGEGRSLLRGLFPSGGPGGGLFPGWYFGLPVLIATVVLAAIAVLALEALARPPFAAAGRADDVASRRRKATSVLAFSASVVAMSLGRLWIFLALAGAGQSTIVTEGGSWSFGSPYEAITPVLGLLGAVLVAAGLAVVVDMLLARRVASAIPAPPASIGAR